MAIDAIANQLPPYFETNRFSENAGSVSSSKREADFIDYKADDFPALKARIGHASSALFRPSRSLRFDRRLSSSTVDLHGNQSIFMRMAEREMSVFLLNALSIETLDAPSEALNSITVI
jgi:hypothetical protein